MSTGKQEEHHEPTGAAGARARRAVIMVAASIVLCIGLLIVLVLAPTTAEVLAAGAWTMPWWILPLTLTVLMVGVFPAMRASMRRWTRWSRPRRICSNASVHASPITSKRKPASWVWSQRR